jgi:2-methylcitrate dehydratase PrpD
MGWDSYANLSNPAVRALLPLIHCEHDADAQAEFPANMSAKLTLRARGRVFTRMVVVPKGEPGNFLTDHELRSKFNALAAPILGEDRAANLADALLALDGAANLGPLMRLVSPAVGARLAGD